MSRPVLLCVALAVLAQASVQAADTRATGSGDIAVRGAEVRPEPGKSPGFSLTDSRRTGVTFTNVLEGDAYLTNAVAHNGAGVAIGDVDGDGWVDFYFCALQGPNRLYRNLGNWQFREADIGDAACPDQNSTGAAFADVDGDGSLDLLVNSIGAGTRLFLNDGKGRLTERRDSGLSRTASATSLALADIDGDGDLDLYCTHYIDVMHLADATTRFSLARREGQWVVTKVNDQPTTLPYWKDRFQALPDGSVRELPEYHGLYRNDGQGRFVSILFDPGVFLDEGGKPIPPTRDWGLSVMFRDLNQDGAPDFYVCNDNASPDRVWMNTGRGTFRALPREQFRHTSRSSMGLDFADVNRDGQDDIFVLDMLARDHAKRMTQLSRDRAKPQEIEQSGEQPRFNRNMLFLGRADGSYTEIALMAGVAATGWSWCPMFVDVDLDGYEDLLVTTGFGMDVMDQDSHDRMLQGMRRMTFEERKRARRLHPAWPTRSLAFRNRGDGTFDLASGWGFDREGISNGAALGDLDNDGDLDVVVNNLNAVASVYRNNASEGRIAVRLKGEPPNTQGVGARIRLIGPSLTQSQEMICGGRYMSGDQAVRVFAAVSGPGESLRLEVQWRDGTFSVVSNVVANRVYEIHEPPNGAPTRPAGPVTKDSLFADVSGMLNHAHVEAPFDDWGQQPLLPRRLSRLGPGVGWYDVDGDGWEDLLVSADRGSRLAVLVNEEGRGFRKIETTAEAPANQGALVGWPDGVGNRHVLVAASHDEAAAAPRSAILDSAVANLGAVQSWPSVHASLGPMATADIDGDGDLDLFVGGRFEPGRYPEPVSSALWVNDGGKLVSGGALDQPFERIGLVSGAAFADLDGDNDSDLALALEWGSIRVFRNEGGRFVDATELWGLAGMTGWWTSVTAGDFDGDGRLDLACGNWGRNTIYELHQPTTFQVLWGDWNEDGLIELVEAWRSGDRWLPVRDRTWLARGLPDLVHRFPTHQAFAQATIEDILPPGAETPRRLEAAHLASTVFLNRGARFEPVTLPLEAQAAPVFAVNVGDFDGDGFEDLFLGQNFFGSGSDLTRDDGGRGLWVRGTGQGRFEAVDGSLSGIRILGEQRGAAVCDFNRDARADLAVAQNDGAVCLLANRGGRPGLRVSLRGPPGNPDGVGTRLRVIYAGDRRGPCRSIQAGSGYWSQDASTQVLGLREQPVGLWIRWADGKEQTVSLKPADRDVRVDFEP
ncbi:MAG TPA: FG-GAP-like repeat-containing protein [Verrucomicrobiota bacterium]|nr:FG-GAP-like repeat-containing protein [Verrucomicrobiota bacterium]